MEVFILKEINEKKYLLPQRVSPTRVELHEVSQELYESINKDINRIRKQDNAMGNAIAQRISFGNAMDVASTVLSITKNQSAYLVLLT